MTTTSSNPEPADEGARRSRRQVDRADREVYNRAVRRHTFLNDVIFKGVFGVKFGEIYERGDEPLPQEFRSEEGIPMAIDRLRRAWADGDLREYIESRDKARMDEVSRIHFARNQGLAEGREEGLAEGREEGLAEGREEGLAEGLATGRAEGLADGRAEGVREAAARLLENGMDRNTVCRLLGLPSNALP